MEGPVLVVQCSAGLRVYDFPVDVVLEVRYCTGYCNSGIVVADDAAGGTDCVVVRHETTEDHWHRPCLFAYDVRLPSSLHHHQSL